jgi:hypothetical protein
MLGVLGPRHGAARHEIPVIRLRIDPNRLHHQMPVTSQHSGRDADGTRPVKSTRRISVLLFGEMHQIKLSVLVPVVFAANVIVATVAWFVVGLLMR